MGRRKRTTDRQAERITPSARDPTKKNMPFFRVYADTVESEQFKSLTLSAQMLYIRMGIASGKDIDDFTFPRRAYKGVFTSRTFTMAKNQLKEAGFIEEKKYYKSESHYKLSSAWMNRPP